MGLDIGQINNLMETGLDGQKAVRPGFHQAINFTISDLHSAGQRGRRNFAGAECRSGGVMGFGVGAA